MTKSRFWKIIAAFLVVAACLALCVFGACSSDKGDAEKDVTSSVDDVKAIDVSYENTETSVTTDGIYLDTGERATLRANVTTKNGKSYSGRIDWTSDDEDVAAFSVGNVLEGKAAGKTHVTVTVRGTEISCGFDVTVSEPGTVFKVGVKDDVKGFGYRDPVKGTYSGLEIDLAGMIFDELNTNYGYGYESMAYIGVLPDDREEYLQSEIVDCVIATYTKTEMRQNDVDFSETYYTDYVGVLMSGSYGDGSLEKLKDVSGYVKSGATADGDITPCRVGFVTDSTALDAFRLYLDSQDIEYTSASAGEYFEYAEYEDYDACELAMRKGDIDLFIADHSILMSHTVSGSVMLDDILEEAEYAVGTKKADGASNGEVTYLTAAIDGLIEEWIEDGTIDSLLGWWLDEEGGAVLTPEKGFEYVAEKKERSYTA